MGKHLRVFYRFTRSNRAIFNSSAHFPTSVNVAGVAWSNPGVPYFIQIPQEHAVDPQRFRTYAQQHFPLTVRQARQLSEPTCKARWFLCYGVALPDGGTQGVLSIDSPDAGAYSKVDHGKLTVFGNLLGAVIAASAKKTAAE
jgi:hypothetical protein